MLKLLFMLVMLFDLAAAASYRFIETRYSDAIDRSVARSGIIDFEPDGLSVEYKKTNESLSYKDGNLSYTKDGEKTTFDEEKTQNLKNYFKLLILIHKGDDSELGDMFDVVKEGDKTVLTPDGEIKHYISKIVLIKNGKKVKSIQLFLANKDRVKIVIEDEVR